MAHWFMLRSPSFGDRDARKTRAPGGPVHRVRTTVFGDPVVATALLDRLLHHGPVLTIRGDGYWPPARSVERGSSRPPSRPSPPPHRHERRRPHDRVAAGPVPDVV
jgi:hypothetical protein